MTLASYLCVPLLALGSSYMPDATPVVGPIELPAAIVASMAPAMAPAITVQDRDAPPSKQRRRQRRRIFGRPGTTVLPPLTPPPISPFIP